MNKALQTVFEYHETTKHSQQRYARSLGYMDWSTQPNPFRTYNGTKTITLPLAMQNATPPYHLLDTQLPSAPLVMESISQLLQFSMGIAAWKNSGGPSWAVRCNASSGNLHPTESYLILPPILKEQNAQSAVLHYAPKNHELELLTTFETNFWSTLAEGSFLLGISSITWREVWKYGERAFRYTNLDAGHAWQSIVVSAKMLGWEATRLDSISDSTIDILLGLHQEKRFFERERGDMILVISPSKLDSSLNLDSLIENIPLNFEGIANKLSPSMQHWDIIPQIEDATHTQQIAQKASPLKEFLKKPSKESKQVVLFRRSVHIMHTEISKITKEQFHAILQSVMYSLDGKENSTHLCIMINRIEEYEKGLYILLRNQDSKEELMSMMHSGFEWSETEFENLYILELGDFQVASKNISCSQDIASDGAFSLGMLSDFSKQILEFGPHRYKELYWECGAIGQQLYLEATSLGLSGTGIGCFLDDMMHKVLGIKDNRYQILYHFTVGRGNVDSRIMTIPAYEREE